MLKAASLIICIFALTVGYAAIPSSASQQQTNEEWLVARMNEAYSVKEGMSRAELLRIFEPTGGMQLVKLPRFVLKSCHLIQVEVEFDTSSGQAHRQVPDGNLRIKKISRPYLADDIKD